MTTPTPAGAGGKAKRKWPTMPSLHRIEKGSGSEDAATAAGPSTSARQHQPPPPQASGSKGAAGIQSIHVGSQAAPAEGQPRRRRRRGKAKKKGPTADEPAAAAYVEDFINVGFMDDVARETSRVLEIATNHHKLAELLEQQMERCLLSLAPGEDDKEDEDGDWVDDDEMAMEEGKYLQNVLRLLEMSQMTADDGVEITASIGDIVDKKLEVMDASSSNLTKAEQQASQKPGPSKPRKAPTTPSKGKRATLLGNVRLGDKAGAGKGDDTPTMVDNQNAGGTVDKSKSAIPGPSSSAMNVSFTTSPARSNASSSSSRSRKPRSLLSSLDPPAIDDSGYRACKFRNPPNYTGMCANLRGRAKVIKRKTPQREKRVGRFEGKYSDTESEDDATTKDSSPSPTEKGPSEKTDSNQPVYCVCRKVSAGKMIECDNKSCPVEWFHFKCMLLKKAPKVWYCPECRGENYSVMKPQSNPIAEGKVAAEGQN